VFDTVKDKNKREKMLAIVELLLKKNALYTNEVAKKLTLKLPYCNRLLDELAASRLIVRVKETSPSGGPIYLNRLIDA
jgi:predicted transcriptional regulator